jgi:hypothetical protein
MHACISRIRVARKSKHPNKAHQLYIKPPRIPRNRNDVAITPRRSGGRHRRIRPRRRELPRHDSSMRDGSPTARLSGEGWGEGEGESKLVKRGTARTSISRRGRRTRSRAGPSGPSSRGGRKSWGRGPCNRSSSRSGPGTAAAAGPDSRAAPASAVAGRKRYPAAAAAAPAPAAVAAAVSAG